MFKKIVLDNYKSFRHIEIDLSGSDGSPLPYAFIYGENGSGKSNLVESVLFLKGTIKTVNLMNTLTLASNYGEAAINQKKKQAGKVAGRSIDGQLRLVPVSTLDPLPNIISLAKEARTIGSETGVSASFHFTVGGHDGRYEMRFGPDDQLIYEKLSFVIESRTKDIFEIRADDGLDASDRGRYIIQKYSPQLFTSKSYGDTVQNLVRKYWGKHSFISILDDQYSANNARYMIESLGTGIGDVIRFFNDLIVSCDFEIGPFGIGIDDKLMASLAHGWIAPDEKTQLLAYEDALNSFFTRICSDIKKAYYRIEPSGGVLTYTLFFTKMIGGKKREISIFKESRGTISMLGLFPALFECVRGKTVFFDELDLGIHDLLIKDVMIEVKEAFKGQLIATTHSTSLLEVIEPKNIFMIQVDPMGEKRIMPLNRIERTLKNHNNRIRYMKGVFGSVPIIGEVDFKDIVLRAEKKLGGGT